MYMSMHKQQRPVPCVIFLSNIRPDIPVTQISSLFEQFGRMYDHSEEAHLILVAKTPFSLIQVDS